LSGPIEEFGRTKGSCGVEYIFKPRLMVDEGYGTEYRQGDRSRRTERDVSD
jgi:hypothetical protein